jgi:glycosyltransferase involved in cell wall biosynthesis
MLKSSPKISVVIPLYNHEKYVEEAVRSVLAQSVSDFELIIINDGSTDNSENIVNHIDDDRIRYVYQENQGAYKTINKGIQLAKGEYISILNSDDSYYPNRFEEFLKILENEDAIYAVFSHVEFIDDQGKSIKYERGAEDNWAGYDPETSFKGDGNIILDLLAGNFLVTTSNLFCRKSVFDSLGFFLNLKYAHDYEFFLRLCYRYKVSIVEEALLRYRIHGANTVKENEAAVSFEVGLTLANFFLNYDMRNVLKNGDRIYENMMKFFNSVNTYRTDRMIMTLLLFGMKYAERKDALLNLQNADNKNPFRKACIDKFQSTIDLWQESQDAWGKWSETNQRLIETDQRLSEANEEKKKWWLNSREAWAKVEAAGDRITELEQKLSESNEEATKWWINSQEAWRKVDETNQKLIEVEQQLLKANDETKKWLSDTWGRIEETGHKLIRAEQQLSQASEEAKKWLSDTWERIEETGRKLIRTEQELLAANEEAKKWQINSREAWTKVEAAGNRISELEQKLAETSEETRKWQVSSQEARGKMEEAKQRLIDTEQKLLGKIDEVQSLRNSRSFRLGRALTWPLRQILLKK